MLYTEIKNDSIQIIQTETRALTALLFAIETIFAFNKVCARQMTRQSFHIMFLLFRSRTRMKSLKHSRDHYVHTRSESGWYIFNSVMRLNGGNDKQVNVLGCRRRARMSLVSAGTPEKLLQCAISSSIFPYGLLATSFKQYRGEMFVSEMWIDGWYNAVTVKSAIAFYSRIGNSALMTIV